MKTVVEIAK